MYYECKFNAFSLFYVRLAEKLFVLQGIFNNSSHLLEQKAWLTDDGLMTDGQLAVEWQTFVNSPLVLHRATDGDVFVAVSPIIGQTFENPFWPLCNHEEMQVTSPLNHQPSVFTPLVGFLDEAVRCEASPHKRS